MRDKFDAEFVVDGFGGVLGAEWEEVGLRKKTLVSHRFRSIAISVRCIANILYNIGM